MDFKSAFPVVSAVTLQDRALCYFNWHDQLQLGKVYLGNELIPYVFLFESLLHHAPLGSGQIVRLVHSIRESMLYRKRACVTKLCIIIGGKKGVCL